LYIYIYIYENHIIKILQPITMPKDFSRRDVEIHDEKIRKLPIIMQQLYIYKQRILNLIIITLTMKDLTNIMY